MSESIEISRQNFLKEVRSDDHNFQLKMLISQNALKKLNFTKGSIYCFLHSGRMKIVNEFLSIDLIPGMYASHKAPCQIELDPNSRALIIIVDDYLSLNQTGGPIEEKGRLRYIDGCSDTLLISPSRWGEPCLNLLHFPANTIQTPHHHPSFRFGVVASGEGECVGKGGIQQLVAGDCFYIPADCEHKFNTKNSSMNVIAFHPDSDWGPTDEIHPMKNRTIIL